MARRATAIEAERKKNSCVLVLDAGNALTGQLLADQTKGRVMIEALNLLGYTAMTIGEKELYLELEDLRTRIKEARFPIVSANLVYKATGQLFAEPYTIVECDKLKIGILGLTNQDAATIPGRGTFEGVSASVEAQLIVTDPLSAAAKYVPEIAQKADIVIVLSHMGHQKDQMLAEQVPGIAVIVGGYTRSILSPPMVRGDTLIVQAGYDGEWLGRLELTVDGQGKVLKHEGRVLALGPEYPDHAQVAQWLKDVKGKAP